MQQQRCWLLPSAAAAMTLIVAACTPPPAVSTGGVQIPELEQGKFNVAFVSVGPIGDGGWT